MTVRAAKPLALRSADGFDRVASSMVQLSRAATAQSRPPARPGGTGCRRQDLERLDETVTRLKLPTPLRRSLACTNSIKNMMGKVHRVCRHVKRWREKTDKQLSVCEAGAGSSSSQTLTQRVEHNADAA
jgi:hypothetical protein